MKSHVQYVSAGRVGEENYTIFDPSSTQPIQLYEGEEKQGVSRLPLYAFLDNYS